MLRCCSLFISTQSTASTLKSSVPGSQNLALPFAKSRSGRVSQFSPPDRRVSKPVRAVVRIDIESPSETGLFLFVR